jgi:cytochrome P450
MASRRQRRFDRAVHGVLRHGRRSASEAEVAAQIEKMMAGAFAGPDVRSLRPAIEETMEEIRKLGGAPKKPWWKLW